MDPLYMALISYRQRKFVRCVQLCTEILETKADGGHHNPAWVLKLRALTQQVAFDDIDVMESLAETSASADAQWTKTARPGTSILATANAKATAAGKRTAQPSTARATSGVVRLNRTGLPGTSRGITGTVGTRANNASQTGRMLSRLGTASLPESQTFLHVARLNLVQLAKQAQLARPLFEYFYFVLGDVRSALELASHAHQHQTQSGRLSTDTSGIGGQHYWRSAIARCMVRMGLVRQVIQSSTASADWYLTGGDEIGATGTSIQSDGILLMAKAFLIVDQPLAAIQLYRRGLTKFPDNTLIYTGIARIHEELGQTDECMEAYRKVLNGEPCHIEAVACMASHHFGTGQHELAFLLYRRLLQMGIHTPEIFCNLALCCWKTQQFDLIFPCLENAFSLLNVDVKEGNKKTSKVLLADIWYNLGHIALSTADGRHQSEMAGLCWRIALDADPHHAQARNNMAVLAVLDGHFREAKALFATALDLDEGLAEAKFNLDRLTEQLGENERLV